MTKKIYKFIDLFCGIGGFRIGLERNGGKWRTRQTLWSRPCRC